MWIPCDTTIGMSQNFPLQNLKFTKYDELRAKGEKKEEKGSPIKLHILFYVNFVLCIILLIDCSFSKFCNTVMHRAIKLLVALVSFKSPLVAK